MTKQLLAATIITVMSLSSLGIGCREEGPAERLGRSLDETADDVADSVNDGVDAVEDAAEETGERIRKGMDEASP